MKLIYKLLTATILAGLLSGCMHTRASVKYDVETAYYRDIPGYYYYDYNRGFTYYNPYIIYHTPKYNSSVKKFHKNDKNNRNKKYNKNSNVRNKTQVRTYRDRGPRVKTNRSTKRGRN